MTLAMAKFPVAANHASVPRVQHKLKRAPGRTILAAGLGCPDVMQAGHWLPGYTATPEFGTWPAPVYPGYPDMNSSKRLIINNPGRDEFGITLKPFWASNEGIETLAWPMTPDLYNTAPDFGAALVGFFKQCEDALINNKPLDQFLKVRPERANLDDFSGCLDQLPRRIASVVYASVENKEKTKDEKLDEQELKELKNEVDQYELKLKELKEELELKDFKDELESKELKDELENYELHLKELKDQIEKENKESRREKHGRIHKLRNWFSTKLKKKNKVESVPECTNLEDPEAENETNAPVERYNYAPPGTIAIIFGLVLQNLIHVYGS